MPAHDQQWFATLVHAMADGVFVVDGTGQVAFANPAAEELVGPVEPGIVGRPLVDVVHPDDRNALVDRLAADPLGSATSLEIRIVTVDGRSVPVEIVATNLAANEHFGGSILSLRDLTHRSPAAVIQAVRHPEGSIPPEVRDALEEGLRTEDIEVHYQPVVDTTTGHAVELEALARWRHPTLGLLRPGEFLEVAQDLGLVTALDWCVLERIALDRERWRAEVPGLAEIPLSVNISVEDVGPELEGRLAAFLASPGGAGTNLHLELGEQVLLRNLEEVSATLERLDDGGIGLTLDASGVGYATLPHLRRLPIRLLKLDRSFLTTAARAGTEVTRAFVELYEALGVRVAAVGVETFEHHQAVRAVGITRAQGFFFAEPHTPTELVARYAGGPVGAAAVGEGGDAMATIRRDLADGLRSEEVEVHYQPIVDTASGRAVGLEALARWRHPTLGLLRPGEFLDVAEELDVVASLDWGVLERVARDRDRWRSEAPRLVDLPLSVNVSLAAIGADLEPRLTAFLTSPGGIGARLDLELSEQVLLDNLDAVSAALAQLGDRGIGLTLDAASAVGHATLAFVQHLPLRVLKLDRSFLSSVTDARAESTSAFVELYEAVGVHVVAVGVETFDHHQTVRAAGIQWAQGYFYAEPRTAGDLTALAIADELSPDLPGGLRSASR